MVQEWKIKETEKIKKAISNHKIIGMVDLHKLPAAQLHMIRQELRGTADIKIAKKCILTRSIGGVKKDNIAELNKLNIENPGIILSNENPFKLFQKINKSKVATYLKAGEKAPKELVIPKGDTKLTPGPIIGELQKAKIKARIQGPIITITEDSKVASEGDEISSSLASILMQLGIKPVMISLNLVAAYEDGIIFMKDTLDINQAEYRTNIQNAYKWSFNLAFNAAYPTKDVIALLIGKAHTDTLNLAINSGVLNKETIKSIIPKAYAQMMSVSSRLPDDARGGIQIATAAPIEEAKIEEKKEEKHEEDKPEDVTVGLGALFG
ncbi:MAG: 50S ribosomal protein L10 [DPANN group archaeon]|nr:50S ribosomal protein L10 [DPANN group archaeon]